ncbi:hypothetical protein F4782DRAFT_126905 [Xylaria castorea]|nr:hypothetical protein F4782DRAFT_126905 [Xylaria castorea]
MATMGNGRTEEISICSSTERLQYSAVRLQFVRPGFFDEAGGHIEVFDGVDGIDVPMHVYLFPQIDEWESQLMFFDVQLHLYQPHVRRKVEEGDESAARTWEDSYGKLAQVRGQMCFQPCVQPYL